MQPNRVKLFPMSDRCAHKCLSFGRFQYIPNWIAQRYLEANKIHSVSHARAAYARRRKNG